MKTALYNFHQKWEGKMVDYFGYELPISYKAGGLLAENIHTRQKASLFDVSHMGQLILDTHSAKQLNSIIPADITTIAEGASKYTVILNDDGGIIDDCIISNDGERGYYIVVNASRKAIDIEQMQATLSDSSQLKLLNDYALFALQGPHAETVVSTFAPDIAQLKFMQGKWCTIAGVECRINRCGYTGEDGFEIAVPIEHIDSIIDLVTKHDSVQPAGLGARDSLRLEAGLCLYGNDLNETITPIEAGLLWSIPKHRRESTDYRGATKIRDQITNGCAKKLIGLQPEGKTPIRAHTPLYVDGKQVGEVTSGCHSPSLGVPIAMGYVENIYKTTQLIADVRGKSIVCQPTSLPFVPHHYKH